MRLLPNFDYETFPYVLLRNKEGLFLINVRSGFSFKSFVSIYQQLPFPQMLVDCHYDSESRSIALYVIEYTKQDSALVKYEMSPDYVGALKILAKKE